MKVEELRKGNWVNYYSGSCHGRILGMSFSEFSNVNKVSVSIEPPDAPGWAGTDLEDLTPIPLNEEWLLKFGFEKTKTQDRWEKKAFGIIDVSFPTCRYIHQLQNIYFALTGEELTIK